MPVTRITYESEDRQRWAVVCRTVDGAQWEVHCCRWKLPEKRNHWRRRRLAKTMTKAQGIARNWTR